MTEQIVAGDGVELCVETFGDPADPAVLLIGGAAMSMDWWEPQFCRLIATYGRLVIRYDHRDTGRSSTSPPGRPDYTSNELFADPLRILDGLGISAAHLAGVSMGGAIAQVLAAQRPDRVRSLTLISTSPAGERASSEPLPPPEPRVRTLFADPPPAPVWTDPAAVVEYVVDGCRAYAGGLGLDAEHVRAVVRRMVERSRDIAACQQNHWILSGESRSFRMADLAVPTLVLHGTDDPFFPLGHGEALAAEIPGARLIPLPGMGHEVPPPQLWDRVAGAIGRHPA